MRVIFGTGVTPTDEVGQILFAGETADLEITSNGIIQIRDVA
jgi:hypothetical protein